MSDIQWTVLEEPAEVNVIESPRHSCALGGAYAAASAIRGIIPLLHSGPGCSWANFFGLVAGSGGGCLGDFGAMITPCTYLLEKHVVFGGEEKLKELLYSTEKLMKADLLVVIPGCIPNMIGDNVPQIVDEYNEDHDVPAIHVKTAGFTGNSYRGYELFLDAAIDQYLKKPEEVKKGRVNILGFAPCQHIFWKGDLREVKRTLELTGLEVNPIFGDIQGIESLQSVPEAELNVVISPWLGIEAAKKLQDKFGTPFIVQEGLPIGPRDTETFIRRVGEKVGIPEDDLRRRLEPQIKESFQFFNYVGVGLYMGLTDSYYAVVPESNIAIGLVRFLTNDAGLLPTVVIVTDSPPEEYKQSIKQRLTENLTSSEKPEVYFENDAYKIENILDKHTNIVILGSSMEKYLAADKYKALHLTVSFPSYDRLLLRRSYFGFFGGINLLEDLLTKLTYPL
ncbi:MAG TPA: nitrogenase component 1 [Methanotrichaceae archaeon]|nr:nitrogenase component 1 [Methanotrichaceae archaeon]